MGWVALESSFLWGEHLSRLTVAVQLYCAALQPTVSVKSSEETSQCFSMSQAAQVTDAHGTLAEASHRCEEPANDYKQL